MDLSIVLNSGAAPGSHEWVPCVGQEFSSYEAFESVMKIMADRNFFVVRFRRELSGSASRHLPRVHAFCNRSSWGRL